MIKGKVILFDMDDTINKFNAKLWEVYNKKFNDNVDVNDVNDWDISKFMNKTNDPRTIFKEPGLFRDLEKKEGVDTLIKKLMLDNEVYLVTDSPQGTGTIELAQTGVYSNPLDDKREWIQENMPYFPLSNLIVCSKKWMIEGDVLLDDKPNTYEEMWKRGKPCILVDAPYNRHIKTKWRAKNMLEAEKLLEDLLVLNNKKRAI